MDGDLSDLFNVEIEHWMVAARRAREAAYAPYSKFQVGAALIASDGRLFAGCNVENISFGLTICAERVALGQAIAAGVRDFVAIAIIADTAQPVSPCGACRQVLAEFNPALQVYIGTLKGVYEQFSLADLLPRATTGILDRP